MSWMWHKSQITLTMNCSSVKDRNKMSSKSLMRRHAAFAKRLWQGSKQRTIRLRNFFFLRRREMNEGGELRAHFRRDVRDLVFLRRERWSGFRSFGKHLQTVFSLVMKKYEGEITLSIRPYSAPGSYPALKPQRCTFFTWPEYFQHSIAIWPESFITWESMIFVREHS